MEMATRRQKAVDFTIALLVLCMASWRYVEARPNGAPQSACGDFIPGHGGVNPQTPPPPFTITTSKETYDPGDKITVTLRATSPSTSMIRGFLIQAQKLSDGLHEGAFDGGVTGSKLTCGSTSGKNALTHENVGNAYESLTFTWTAPAQRVGHLQFRATVAADFDTYWLNVESNVLADPTADPLPTLSTAEQETTIINTPVDLSGCGSDKGCITNPEGCASTDCTVIATWKADGDAIEFEIARKGTGWVAIGLSRDQGMGQDSVMECLRGSSNKMLVSQSYNPGRSNMELANPHDEGITNVRVGFVDGQLLCQFRRQMTSSRPDKIFDMASENYFFLLAHGDSIDDPSDVVKPVKKTKHVIIPLISGAQIDPTSTAGGSLGSSVSPLLKAHGAIMIIAWVIAATFGILTARHYKTLLPGKKVCGVDIWFGIHRPTMVVVLLLTIAAFIIIFVQVEGYSRLEGTTPAILRAHPILGIIVTGLAIANPIMAIFRCHPGTPFRPIFNWAHWGVGTLARILAIITVYLGISLLRLRAMDHLANIIWVMVGFTILHVLVEVILELHKCFVRNSSASNDMEMKMTGSSAEPVMVRSAVNTPTGAFKIMIYIFYIIGVLAFGLAMVIMVATA